MNTEDGRAAVMLARRAAEAEAAGNEPDLPPAPSPEFGRPGGAFTTIRLYPSGRLRACIGHPLPVMPLWEAVAASARGAVHDPRFPVLAPGETDGCVFEVTLLGDMKDISGTPDGIVRAIVIGRDGLNLTLGGRRAIFLPQVPVEQGWNVIDYLENLCLKAGLPPHAWKDPGAVLETFPGEIFAETSPRGPIARGGRGCRTWWCAGTCSWTGASGMPRRPWRTAG